MSADIKTIEDGAGASSPRSRRILIGFMLVCVAVFVGLGSWQVQRLFWKLDLIERVDARVHAAPVPAPGAAEWANVEASKDEYRRVSLDGSFQHDKSVLVQAVTERGPGFWVVTPLVRATGDTILVNRGFVPGDRRDPSTRAEGDPSGPVEVIGLMRMTEPGGGFLRANDPAGDRWFSRDVAAIAAARGLSEVAPYFVDADTTPNPGGLPIGGLTVVSFRNSHLVYALTWFSLAAMGAIAAWFIHRRRFR